MYLDSKQSDILTFEQFKVRTSIKIYSEDSPKHVLLYLMQTAKLTDWTKPSDVKITDSESKNMLYQ